MLLRGRNQGARRVQPVRLELEELENRLVPAALTPMQVRHAYGFDQITFNLNGKSIVGDGAGQTIAIVNAYDNAKIFSDVDYFNRSFGITAGKTLYQQYGAASTWLTKVSPQGIAGADPTGGLWYLETALDVEWAHAIAPAAKILLVQAKSGSYTDLFAAVDYARAQAGVVAVSMSWGSTEWNGENYYDFHFTTPAGHLGGSNGQGGARLAGGVTFVAAAGDDGAPGGWPAMSPNVLSVGGTKLTVDSAGNYQGEVAWSESGGGTSKYENRPGWQVSVNSTGKRTIPDVAYNADPLSGVYVYSTMPLNGRVGAWWAVGGTSAGAPQWAALVAIADQGRALAGLGSLDGPSQALPAIYNMAATDFHDVTTGSNGNPARPGYDLVTGRGTPYAHRIVSNLLRADTQGRLATTALKVTVPAAATARPLVLFYAVDVNAEQQTNVTFVLIVDNAARANDAPTAVAQPDVANRPLIALSEPAPVRRLTTPERQGPQVTAVEEPLADMPMLEFRHGTEMAPIPLDDIRPLDHEPERAVTPLLDAYYTEAVWHDLAPAAVLQDASAETAPAWLQSVVLAVLSAGVGGMLVTEERRRKQHEDA